jgi:uncharacterized protein YwgA
MTTTDMVMSILDSMNEQIKGKTMLQKVVFILSHEFPRAKELGNLNYTKYYYGPFSRKLEEIINDCQLRGLLRVIPTQVGNVVRYDIEITDAGRQYVKQSRRAGNSSISLLREMSARARELNAMDLSKVIDLAYGLL